ncbi:MAG: hypothetical protein OEU92_30000 [Alphaproteobacteria bacterium]|nr:hypothetical protein [Alphaproteobacteria bacterium]
MITRLIQAALHPEPYRVRLLRPLLRRMTGLPFELRLQFDLLERPHYAYCVWHAARLAKRLEIPAITVIEMGVAGGNGLLCLERHAEEVEKVTGVEIKILGFDTGKGMPEPSDYRDCPQIWQAGFYKMDAGALVSRLRGDTKLWLGDVAEQVVAFAKSEQTAPVGAVMFDMDFYSATMESFKLFDSRLLKHEKVLPRIMCYFDDIVHGDPIAGVSDDVGQRKAIEDYNASCGMTASLGQNSRKRISPDRSLLMPRKVRARWNSQIFIHHDFAHPRYGDFVGTENDQRRLP